MIEPVTMVSNRSLARVIGWTPGMPRSDEIGLEGRFTYLMLKAYRGLYVVPGYRQERVGRARKAAGDSRRNNRLSAGISSSEGVGVGCYLFNGSVPLGAE